MCLFSIYRGWYLHQDVQATSVNSPPISHCFHHHPFDLPQELIFLSYRFCSHSDKNHLSGLLTGVIPLAHGFPDMVQHVRAAP